MNMKTKHIAVVGIDGCGKSSCYRALLNQLANRRVAGIGDLLFISKNGELKPPEVSRCQIKLFLGKKAKNLKNRTFYKLLKFIELIYRVRIQREIEQKYRPQYIITDGCALINMIAWGNYYYSDLFNEKQCKEVIQYMTGTRIPLKRSRFYYTHLREVFLINLLRIRFQLPDILVFLTVSPSAALERIAARKKRKQVHESIDFLANLQDAYHLTCKILKDQIRIYTIDTNGKTIEQVIKEIKAAFL